MGRSAPHLNDVRAIANNLPCNVEVKIDVENDMDHNYSNNWLLKLVSHKYVAMRGLDDRKQP
jgi:hypothetical protein